MTACAPAGETPEGPGQASESVLTQVPVLTQEKAGVSPGGLRAGAAASSPSPGPLCKHKHKHKRYGVSGDPRQSESREPYCDHAEWIMAGSAPFHVPNGEKTTGGLGSGHYCRTYTRHISPFCVFKCSPYLVFVTILKNALSLG